MTETRTELAKAAERLAKYRARVAAIREQAQRRYAAGGAGVHVTAGVCEATEELVLQLLRDAVEASPEAVRETLPERAAVLAVGGTGRGELAPYSDVDLLFLQGKGVGQPFVECVARVVRDCWDIGLRLGHSVRTPEDALAMAGREPQFATALIEARLLWGSERLSQRVLRKFRGKVIRRRRAAFIEECIAAREAEFAESGAAVQQLQPDVKRSPGGLRDLHLIRWVGFARFGTADINLLRMQGALSREDAQTLLAAQEFLTRLRVDLHLAAGKSQDVLSRDEQLRVAREWNIEPTAGQSAVERFMQQYFRQTTAVAAVTRRFIARHRSRPLWARLSRFLFTHRANGVFRVNSSEIDVFARHRAGVCADLERLLSLYELASLYRVLPSPPLLEALKESVPKLPAETLSPQAARLFLSILGRGAHLGFVLRSLFHTGVLEKLIPDFAHVRCLLQFNQYHHYTVDEHSLQAVEAAARLEQDPGPLGEAYRSIHHKEILHLALLLHDIGKGFDEDHSEVGRRIAEGVADRLGLSNHLREVLVFLVHKHLMMGHLALRRNTSDPEVLLRFTRDVGSPEILRILYVLTAADMTAVGPGVWTNWKAELLTELYDRAMLILSGEPNPLREAERLRHVRREVRACLAQRESARELPEKWVDETLDGFPANYLLQTPAEQIAAALECVSGLGPDDVVVQSEYDPNRNTIEHRIIAHDHIGSGCFTKMAGVLTANRLEILSAQINTSSQGIVLDSFRVVDYDFAGPVPQSRLEEIERSIRDVLTGRCTVESLFRSRRRFGADRLESAVSDLPTRVVIDNDTSDRHTIIDVFAHDRTGLLYTIAGAILDLDLSVSLAKIATHLDQVVDVFYVTDRQGRKISDGHRLATIRVTLEQKIEEFQQSGLAALEKG